MPRHRRLLLAAAITLTVTGCTSTTHGPEAAPTSTGSEQGLPLPAATSTVYPAHCQTRDNNQLPDPACTPGAINPAVTQATISTTICTSGWTDTIRPPTSYTNRIKQQAIAAYGDYAGSTPDTYELDRLISLELGGSPTAAANLWPEKGLHNAKDPVENAAKRAVCAGRMSLADAQRAIATNWIALGHQLDVSGIPAS